MSYRPAPAGAPLARRAYPSDLSAAQWERIAPLLPGGGTRGQPRLWPLREIVDTMLYVLHNGCVWRALPHEDPPWPTVWTYVRRWRDDGTWETVHDALHREARVAAGRDPEPSAGVLDSQSVETTEGGAAGLRRRPAYPRAQARPPRGHAGLADRPLGGRRRHAGVGRRTGAGAPSAAGASAPVPPLGRHRLRDQVHGLGVDVVTKVAGQQGFAVQPRRWVVSWISQRRRLAKDDERLEESTDAWIYLAMLRLLSRRFAQNPC